jgi:hypothetical protein
LGEQTRPRIVLETLKRREACLVCNAELAADCQDLARTFSEHLAEGSVLAGKGDLLQRIDRAEDWGVCERCQSALGVEDKMRLMSLWIVLEGMRNWLRTEARLSLTPVLPAPPPVQLA